MSLRRLVEVRALTPAEREGLGFFARVKLFVHGGRQAFAVRAADCRACSLCISVCPEDAIQLVPAG